MSNIEFEEVACDLCDSAESTPVVTSPDHWQGKPGLFTTVRCDNCGLFFLNPRPTEHSIGNFYPSDYYAYDKSQPVLKSGFRKKLKQLIRRNHFLSAIAKSIPVLRKATRDPWLESDIDVWIPPGSILDVGCGSGGYLNLLADFGWKTYGLEPSMSAADIAVKNGHKVFCQSATEPLPGELHNLDFDLIYMSHSLEHVHYPTRVLEALFQILKPKTGHIIIEVPNIDSVFTRLFHELSLAFDAPRHLFMFSPHTLTELLRKTGFEVHKLRHISRPAQMVKCLTLVSKIHQKDWHFDDGSKLLEDPAFGSNFSALARFANSRGMGGAIRCVATRP